MSKIKKAFMTVGVVMISAILLLTATFTFFTANETVLARFSSETGSDNNAGVEIIEDFSHPDAIELEAGTTVQKNMKMIQTDTGPAVVRVRIEEYLTMLEVDTNNKTELIEYKSDKPEATDLYPKKTTLEAIEEHISVSGMTEIDQADLPYTLKPMSGTLHIYGKTDSDVDSDDTTIYSFEYFAAYEGSGYWQMADITIPTLESTTIDNAADYLTAIASSVVLEYCYYKPSAAVEAIFGAEPVLKDNAGLSIHDYSDLNDYSTDTIQLVLGASVKPISDYKGTSDLGEIWYYDSDGWFYYAKTLKAGDVIQLLESITLSNDIPDNWIGINYDIHVRMQAVQSISEVIEDKWNKEISPENMNNPKSTIYGQSVLTREAAAFLNDLISTE